MQNSELLRLKPVNSAIRKGRLGWFGRAERKDNIDLIKRCTKIKIGVRQRLGRKSGETGGTRGGRCNANCTSRFCHVSKFQAPDYLHYNARRGGRGTLSQHPTPGPQPSVLDPRLRPSRVLPGQREARVRHGMMVLRM